MTTIGTLHLTLTAFAVLAALWFVAFALELLPLAIERWLAHRAARSPTGPGKRRSLWFVDVDAEEDRRADERRERGRGNPTLW